MPTEAEVQALVEVETLVQARIKFDELDTNGNGLLDGDELVQLVEWLWTSCHSIGEPLSDKHRATKVAKLLWRLDANGDGCMSFEEFGGWFERACANIEHGEGIFFAECELATQLEEDLETSGEAEVLECELMECEVMYGELVARQFNELDADHDGAISKQEWLASGKSEQSFEHHDLDGDAVVDQTEFTRTELNSIVMASKQATGAKVGNLLWSKLKSADAR